MASRRKSTISLLRGINVGAHHRVPMAELRDLYASLGLSEVQTYVQSGNVVFRTTISDETALSRKLEEAIEERFGFRCPVVIRSAAGLRETVARNPFAGREGIEPAKLQVMFLASDPGPEVWSNVRAIATTQEELHAAGREFYLYFPNGMSQSKLSLPLLERTLKIPVTGRNWNTVLKLLTMAEAMDSVL